jgi:hypothetical protein
MSYAADKQLPKLGGLFRDVFHAAFADGNVLVLTKQYDEAILRAAITSNGGEVTNLDNIEANPPRRMEKKDGKDSEGAAAWRQTNEFSRYLVERSRERLRLLKEEREVQRELSAEEKRQPPSDPILERLKQENVRLIDELTKLRAESEAVMAEIRQMQKTPQKKAP